MQALPAVVEMVGAGRRPAQVHGAARGQRRLALGAQGERLAADRAMRDQVGAQVFHGADGGGHRPAQRDVLGAHAQPVRGAAGTGPPSVTSSGRTPSQCAARPAPTSLPAMRSPSSRSRFIAGVPTKLAANVVAGCAYSSRGDAACSMRPLFSSTTWSAMLIASAWSWVT